MQHRVTFSVPERELGRADIEFLVKLDDTTLGRLKVSRGGPEWVVANNTYGYKMTWKTFAEIMSQKGTRKQ